MLTALHALLLPETIDNALRCPFYRDLWRGSGVTRSTSITELPFTRRADVVAAGRSAQVRDGQVCDVRFTGGTTGAVFPYVVGQREQVAVQQFYAELHATDDRSRLRRALRFNDTHVAFERTVPVPMRTHKLNVYSNGTFAYGRDELLSVAHDEEGVEPYCTVLAAGERILRAFTEDTVRACPAGFQNPLEYILTYGFLMTRPMRARYEEVWQARLVDRYGLAEVTGGATEDLRCGWYHFDPTVVPEVVGPTSKAPVREGRGILVLTPLYPFQESQPLVRYWTDDLVEVTHTRSSVPGALAIRPLGRAAWGAVATGTDDWVLPPDVVYQVMESSPQVDRLPILRDAKQVLAPDAIGLPLYAVRRTTSGRLQIALSFRCSKPPAAREAVATAVREQILALAPALDTACRAGSCSFTVLAEG